MFRVFILQIFAFMPAHSSQATLLYSCVSQSRFSFLKASAKEVRMISSDAEQHNQTDSGTIWKKYTIPLCSLRLLALRQCARLNSLLVGRVESVRACVSEHSSNSEPRGNERLQSYTLRRQNYSIEIYLVANVGSRRIERISNSNEKKRLFFSDFVQYYDYRRRHFHSSQFSSLDFRTQSNGCSKSRESIRSRSIECQLEQRM